MLTAILEFLLSCVLGLAILLVIGLLSGHIAIKGTSRYERFEKTAEEFTRERLKNRPHSTREELMEWHEKYHKK